ncbi:MAG: diphthamide biosynthesis enzyme Dph2, partial [Candidatus Marsarchaeota archaeon]|nr:diphthamide biosynthesis enzyme Dph2 [Candidatus Marsarchaeota archaeon]
MKILLQFPEGLKQHALEHAKSLEAQGYEVIVSCSPTYGACDIAIEEARVAGADKIIHFGHAEFAPKVQKLDYPVEYVEYNIKAGLSVLESSLSLLKEFKTIALVTTVQHLQQMPEIREFYEKKGKEVVVGKPNAFAKYDGQILGCDAGSATSVENSADCILYFGGGLFHPIGALMETKKPFIIADPFSNKAEDISSMREAYRKKSRGKILSAIEAKAFGIIVSTKNGQMRMQAATAIESAIKKQG